MDRETQNKLAERAHERREETRRAWSNSPRLQAVLLRYRKELLTEEERPLVAAE